MIDRPARTGMLGPFWVVEDQGRAVLVAHAVPLDKAVPYGDRPTVEAGHFDVSSELARRGPRLLCAAGVPTAPVWSEIEGWPRGRVLYDNAARYFVIRAGRQLHRPAFVRLVTNHFRVAIADTTVLSGDHYRSVRRVPLPTPRDTKPV